MYGYAGSSALATELSQFVDPPKTTNAGAVGGQSAAVAQATAQPAGQSAQTVATTASQLIASVPQALHQLAASPAAITTQHGLVWNTIEDFLTYGLPTPTNNWIGLAPGQYTAILKQTLQAYFGIGLANFGWSIGQQTFNGPLGTTAGSGGAFIPSPTPTNNWIGLAPGQYTAIIKQTLQAYFGLGVANFGWSIGQQTFNGPLGTTAGSGGAFIPSPQFAALGAGGWHFHAAVPSASLSSATRIGGLSVPSSWLNGAGAPVTAGEQAATKLVSANFATPGGPGSGVNAALPAVPMAGGRGAQRAGNLGVRYGFRYSVLTRPPSAG
ncbi:PPE family protein [Mycobacterium tuberculosis]|nr:PPE family protein [Mycobacterium tuberculosis]